MESVNRKRIGRMAGIGLLAMIIIGMVSAFTIGAGIDINLSGDTLAVSEAMLSSETRLRGVAYIGLLLAAIEAMILIAFYLLLKRAGVLPSLFAFLMGFLAVGLAMMGSVYAMNAAAIGSQSAYNTLANGEMKQGWTALQVTAIYTSFHLSLVLGSLSKAVFFGLFWKDNGLPKLIAGWGVFASLFVGVTIVARDFIPVLGANAITGAFMLSNMIALVSTGLYLAIKGGRP